MTKISLRGAVGPIALEGLLSVWLALAVGAGVSLVAEYLTRRRLVAKGDAATARATVAGVLVEVPVMLSHVAFTNRTQHWFPRAGGAS